jgi:regulator of sigma E protease
VGPLARQTVKIEYTRHDEPGVVSVTIGEDQVDGKTVGRLGIFPSPPPADHYYRRNYTVLGSFTAAVEKTWDSSVFTVTMLSRMVTGDVSLKNISGPINIAQIAGEAAQRGWRYFVSILAIISISLGVLNLLPVPVLDGGQIVYQLVEALKGSPLTERAQIIGQQVGILALLLLMSFAFYNDLAR